MRWSFGAVVLLVSLGAGCFAPDITEGLVCGTDRSCPEGQICDLDSMTCGSRIPAADDAGKPATDGGGAATDATSASEYCSDPDIALCLLFDGNFNDQSSLGHTVISEGTVEFITGRSGQAASFDGNGWLRVGSYRPGSSGETIEGWIQLGGGADPQYIFSSTAQFELRVEGDTLIGSSAGNSVSTGGIGTGFAHVAIRVDGSTMSLVVNGSGLASVGFSDAATDPDLAIGSSFGVDGFTGRVDQLRVWTRALTSDEIRAIAL